MAFKGPGPGRPKGSQNKITTLLKDAILDAGAQAHPEGLTGYLREQAKDNPAAFMTLLGKVLPLQVGGDPSNPVRAVIEIVTGVDRED
jgi:hypothetical protein